jgi:hypothetical protein
MVLVGQKAIFKPVFLNKLVILCTEGPRNVKVTHLLLCCCGECVCVTLVLFVMSFSFSSWMMCLGKPLFWAIVSILCHSRHGNHSVNIKDEGS